MISTKDGVPMSLSKEANPREGEVYCSICEKHNPKHDKYQGYMEEEVVGKGKTNRVKVKLCLCQSCYDLVMCD